MNDRNKEPSAFPHDHEYKYGTGVAHRDSGMTLRGYFAAHALSSIIQLTGNEGDAKKDVNAAYGYADLMLKAREA